MKPRDWLDTFLGSRTRAGVLRTMLAAGERPLHTREIARLAGAEYRSVWRELQRFEDLGLAEAERVGRRRFWRLPQNSPLLPPLADLVRILQDEEPRLRKSRATSVHKVPHWLRRILRDLRRGLVEMYGERFVGLWLYGSQARGDADEESDIDIIVRLADLIEPGNEIDGMAPLLAEINLRTGALLAVIPVAESEFQQAMGAFWRSVREEGVAA